MKKLALILAILTVSNIAMALSPPPPPPPEEPDLNESPIEDFGWTNSSDSIDNCKQRRSCTTNDSFKTRAIHADKGPVIHLESGDTGYCGKATVAKSFDIPENTSYLNFNLKAKRSSWGKNWPIVVKINGKVFRDFKSDDSSPKEWSWQSYSYRLNQSKTVNLSLSIVDQSKKWCDMGDHTKDIYLHNVSFSQSPRKNASYPKMERIEDRTRDYNYSRSEHDFEEMPKTSDEIGMDIIEVFRLLLFLL